MEKVDYKETKDLFVRTGTRDHIEYRKKQIQEMPENKTSLRKRKAKLLEILKYRK